MELICKRYGYEHSQNPATGLKEGFEKFREALEKDAKDTAMRTSGLPKDWRNRILK